MKKLLLLLALGLVLGCPPTPSAEDDDDDSGVSDDDDTTGDDDDDDTTGDDDDDTTGDDDDDTTGDDDDSTPDPSACTVEVDFDGTLYEYLYDERGWQVGSSIGGVFYGRQYVVDAQGRPVEITSSGVTIFYIWDANGRMIRMEDSTGTVVAEYGYDAQGRLTSATGSGITLTYEYQDGLVSRMDQDDGSGVPEEVASFTWDLATGCLTAFEYYQTSSTVQSDSAGRVTQITGASSTWTMDYGPAPGCTVASPFPSPGGGFTLDSVTSGTPGRACVTPAP